MFLRYFTLLFLGILSQITPAQMTISSTEFLSAVKTNKQIVSDSTKLSQLKDLNFNLPLLKSVEFRSETRDMLLERQEYSMRVKPNSLWAKSTQKKVYYNKIEAFSIKNKQTFNNELIKRYLLIIDYFFSKHAIVLQKEKHLQLLDKLEVLKQYQNQIEFDFKDYINTENDLFENNLKQINLQQAYFNYLREIQQILNYKGDSLHINMSDIISPEEVEIISKQDRLPLSDNTDIKLQQLKLNTLEKEMKLETYQSRQILDYIQAKYGGKKTFLFNENFSIGFGINLPLFGNSRYKKSKYMLDIINKQSELISLKQKTETNYNLAKNSFELAKINYQSFDKQLKNSNILILIDNYKKIEAVNPLVLLKLKILKQKLKIQRLNAQHKMYRAYIKLLESKGVLFKEPYQNFLSNKALMLF
jgi:hypothetical protein